MFKENFDVAIIGAGPAGCAAALSLADETSNVVVLEKKREIGFPVICGEFIPDRSEIKRLMPRSSRISNLYRFVSSKIIKNKTETIKVFTPKNKEIKIKFKGVVLERKLLEKGLAAEAEKKGIQFILSCHAKEFHERKDCVEILVNMDGKTKHLKSRVVIGADGFPSVVARSLKMETGYSKKDVALCLNRRMINVECDENEVEVYFGTKWSPGGYGWIIPKGGGEANVGIGIRMSKLKNTLKPRKLLDYFISKHEVASKKLKKAKTISFNAKILPVGGLVSMVQRDKVLLAGDSAGTIIATNGSGIPTAFVSGSIAGETVCNYLKKNGLMQEYRKKLEGEIGKEIALALTYRRFSDKIMFNNAVFHGFIRLAGDDAVKKVLKGEETRLKPLLRGLEKLNLL